MRIVAVEISKLARLRSTWWAVATPIALVAALTTLNASAVRRSLIEEGPSSPLQATDVGAMESLLAVAACAAVGALVLWQEWRPLAHETGGGRQSVSTRLAVPSQTRWLLAKGVVAAAVSALVMTLSLATGALVARQVLREFYEPVSWSLLGRTLLLGVATALMSAGLTLLLRHGLVPMVWLMANSTVISIGYLLAQRWHIAWYLPDTIGSALVRPNQEPGMPPTGIAAVVQIGWVVAVWVVAMARERCRDE